MEMCIDNPRTDFTDIFATHPPIDKRVEVLVKLAGGHDPGPLALPAPGDDGEQAFLPHQPPVELGRAPREGGPWGPRGPWGRRRN
jgi:heat shock protein HtpX